MRVIAIEFGTRKRLRSFTRMANKNDPLVRYLIVQMCLSAAVGLVFGGAIVVADVNGIGALLAVGHPADAVIVLGSAVIIFFPFVMATSIGVFAWERED